MGKFTADADNFIMTETAILLATTNKYTPGKQKFKLQHLTGLKENIKSTSNQNIGTSNLLNADPSSIPITSATVSSIIELEIPYEVSRRYPTKFIPPLTPFIVTFKSGDITKPVIIGGEF
jgi:hypothetical protein